MSKFVPVTRLERIIFRRMRNRLLKNPIVALHPQFSRQLKALNTILGYKSDEKK